MHVVGFRLLERFARPAALAVGMTLSACESGPPTAPDAVVLPSDALPSSVSAVTARWTKVRYAATGTATLSIQNGVARLDFSSDFSIERTPGPVVYLNTTNNPNSGTPLRVGALKSQGGAQTYAFQVPAGVRYSWILIWCDPFNVAMAEASIPPTP